ncbi:3-deoxy-D-manno-octulosonic acid transferase [Desulfopila aestuarii]|uniref:3-deoxy-D-manno-octulosonic acid transferase n=1 Tax=Desulfopila aestuarii DSM 18488 TaxID=1121416 RepID=A0A1M7Y887_9BACT|nr:glycosyltransferase N-terminal domain-containing protein [Desulfopila aestuarii]SHO48766.1 3-deoxy-D-manno-octulosonic-acid transferase [Desulfopila aestuarii DSM 18488]
MIRILFIFYHLAWLAALPLLRRFPRISLGWDQRTLRQAPDGPFDLWIQSASGGESLLSNAIVADLTSRLPADASLRVLLTSGTQQGIDTLQKGMQQRGDNSALNSAVSFFPFDSPAIMAKAFTRFRPRLIVVLETELWPGLLNQAKKRDIPVLLINGRMSQKSFRWYQRCRWLFKPLAPKHIWAISNEDASRFGDVLGSEKVKVMNNIKFDRIEPQNTLATQPPFSHLFPHNTPFVLLGSIRKEEEDKIVSTIAMLLQDRQDCIIGVFPKHIERADDWLAKLREHNITAVKRSLTTATCQPGSVIVWDVFGELAGAYGLARVTFIGGSLMDLGGQNFLEPLVFGLRPLIGPYWSNFSWVTREIIDTGLVREVTDEKQLYVELLNRLDRDEPREQVIEQVVQFLGPRKGGTRLASREIMKILHPDSE